MLWEGSLESYSQEETCLKLGQAEGNIKGRLS